MFGICFIHNNACSWLNLDNEELCSDIIVLYESEKECVNGLIDYADDFKDIASPSEWENGIFEIVNMDSLEICSRYKCVNTIPLKRIN